MTPNLIIQYTIVGIIILGAIIWVCVKFFTKKGKSGCSCCPIAEKCGKPAAARHRRSLKKRGQ